MALPLLLAGLTGCIPRVDGRGFAQLRPLGFRTREKLGWPSARLAPSMRVAHPIKKDLMGPKRTPTRLVSYKA